MSSSRLLRLTQLGRRAVPSILGRVAHPSVARPLISAVSRTSPFSTSVPARGHGLVDSELTQKLGEELTYEQEQSEETPEFLKAFQEQGLWEVDDEPGSDEFNLRRSFGNEKITIRCSVSDMVNNSSAEEDPFSEDSDSQAAESGDLAAEGLADFPVDALITVEKPGKGVLVVEATFEVGEVGVSAVRYINDATTALANTAEGDWKRRYLYAGPQYGQLDENVQLQFDQWLAERGIDTGIAVFLPNYMEYKEQKEYVRWLAQVKGFVQA
ncbi:mitochondrial glyco protein [Piptocephalis cylindrospora]|uniref:Mitochondrial glyco protein n=1 Tax=Piptocephalis cylindrospora TaxID=1907219 RepID=A0A4P9Y7L4_9FUNG|nr:mitochondrial glyco protein [Piptocephalis cylindrospora]|eukprot:RKP15126.1 mitochondrial glyco protein [Piptocephalis cylindrospora]